MGTINYVSLAINYVNPGKLAAGSVNIQPQNLWMVYLFGKVMIPILFEFEI